MRKLKEEQANNPELEFMNEDIDVMSESTFRSVKTGSSRSSKKSNRSSKSSKSRLRSKEGGRFEEEYLQDAIKQLIVKCQNMKTQMKDILRYLAFDLKITEGFDFVALFEKTELLLKEKFEFVFCKKEFSPDYEGPIVEAPILDSDVSWKLSIFF